MKGNGCASPRRVHEEATLSIPPWMSPTKDFPTQVDLHEEGDLLALTNFLVQLHNLVGGPQATPNQSRRHHPPNGNRWCVDDEHLALVLQMIVSPTLNSLTHIWLWWKKDLSGKQLGEG